MVRLLSSLLVLTALGCGSPPPTAAPAPVASTAPATSSSAPPGTSEPRVASGTMRSAWPFTRTSRALYADIGGLLATATFGHLAALAPHLEKSIERSKAATPSLRIEALLFLCHSMPLRIYFAIC